VLACVMNCIDMILVNVIVKGFDFLGCWSMKIVVFVEICFGECCVVVVFDMVVVFVC